MDEAAVASSQILLARGFLVLKRVSLGVLCVLVLMIGCGIVLAVVGESDTSSRADLPTLSPRPTQRVSSLPAPKRNDSPLLPQLVERAETLHGWFGPTAAMADRGYDSRANHEFLIARDTLPIIHIRKSSGTNKLYEGIYTEKGIPTCLGQVPMEYLTSHPRIRPSVPLPRRGLPSGRFQQGWGPLLRFRGLGGP